ncbi:MAG: type II toxin-antitoxin system VapC family toxin [Gammaproteobacteria bacterium]|nr:type II toxin-antitoxin system VapC family toxin [Gammaproteobacteria bacterium]MYF58042.1 type II toxin-antitoxin system VapC family toxin [Gammaproteobacteria bacterium]
MQRLLLDTHAFIWWLSDVPQLTQLAHDGIADPRNEVLVSAISGWEIAVKRAKGRITAPDNLGTMVTERGFTHLPLSFQHAEQAGRLPMHHRDPFDRFLIAQAQCENLILVTRDARIRRYDVRTLAA